jgi:dethiobiotin synthetase
MRYFVTAIGTDSGKTIASAILCEALGADYWKPIQSGTPRDTDTVRALVTRSDIVMHPERYFLQIPASPHAAARAEGIDIDINDFTIPDGPRPLVIEGAGGIMVPINDSLLMIDLVKRTEAEIVVVSNHYLGSINHTLLTAEAINRRCLPVKGIIFNGNRNEETEKIILRHTGWSQLLQIEQEKKIDKEIICKYAQQLRL